VTVKLLEQRPLRSRKESIATRTKLAVVAAKVHDVRGRVASGHPGAVVHFCPSFDTCTQSIRAVRTTRLQSVAGLASVAARSAPTCELLADALWQRTKPLVGVRSGRRVA
jgi:hypothetical protein